VKNKNHPSVDKIYTEQVKQIPSLSRTTVYKTMDLFCKKKVAISVNIEDKEVRYDADTSAHGHFKCQICKKVFDFDIDDNRIVIEKLNRFKIINKQFNFYGICPDCLD
jgi:Fur family peroxide stress response transcriptional regulator